MKNVLFLLLVSVIVAGALASFAACTVYANVGDVPPETEAGGDAPIMTETESGTIDGDTADGDSATSSDAGCGIAFAQQGTFIDVQANPGVPPQYTGGTIVAGFYVLTSMTYYSPMTGTAERRETLDVRGIPPNGAFERIVEQRNPTGDYTAIAAHGETSSWNTPNAEFLYESLECPTVDMDEPDDFTASGTTLTVYFGAGADSYERVYERVSE